MNEADALAHRDVIGNLQNILTKTQLLNELVEDLKLNSEHFAYQYALEGYNTVQRGKEQNVPGADTFYNLLKPYFDRPDQDTEEPEPPIEP